MVVVNPIHPKDVRRYSYTRQWRGAELTTRSEESADDAIAKMRAWLEADGWTPPRLWQFWRWPEMMVYGREA